MASASAVPPCPKPLKRIDSRFSEPEIEPTLQKQISVEMVYAEKDVRQILGKAAFKSDFPELIQLYQVLYNTVSNEDGKLNLQLKTLDKLVTLFKQRVNTLGVGNSCVFPQLRDSMEKTETCISRLRTHIRVCYEQNLDLERHLTHEVKLFDEMLLQLERPVEPPPISQLKDKSHTSRHIKASQPEAVVAYDDFVTAEGGLSGGWDSELHQRFAVLYNANVPKGAVMATIDQIVAIHRHFPTMKPEAVESHCSWFAKYLRLLDAKRTAIKNWRVMHEISRQHRTLVEEMEQSAAEKRLDEGEQERAALDRLDAKIRVALWKETKERAEYERMEKANALQQKELAEERERFARHQGELKARLQDYNKARKRRVSVPAPVQSTPKPSPKNLESIKRRNELLQARKLRERRQADAQRVSARQSVIAKLSTATVTAERDPSRLLRLTTSAKYKSVDADVDSDHALGEQVQKSFAVPKIFHR